MTRNVLVVEHEEMADAALIAERATLNDVDLVKVGPASGVEVPPNAHGHHGVVILGGSMGPTDDDIAPWLPATRRLIRDCVANDTPMLAVCLGAQLTAVALGGKVTLAARPEVGLGTVRPGDLARWDPLFSGLPREAQTLQWHWLEISELPPGATLLASGENCRIQAFKVGACAWATQFHLEAVISTARRWGGPMSAELLASGLDQGQVVQGWESGASGATRTWSDVIDRWFKVVHTIRN